MEGRQPNSTEEIDLLYLFRPVFKRARQAGNAVARHFAAIRANPLVFLLIVILFTALGYCVKFIIRPTYKTESQFVSRLLPPSYCASLASVLDKHKGEPMLAEKLHVSQSIADEISHVEVIPFKDSFRLHNRDSAAYVFTIQLRLNSMEHLDSIQTGLLGYFENVEYAVKQKEIKRKALLELKSNIEARLVGLDSVRDIVNKSIPPHGTGTGIILGQPINPVTIYQTMGIYYQQKLNVEDSLININNMTVMQSFVRLDKYNYPNYILITLSGFAAGLILAILFTPAFGRKRK